MTDWKRKLAAYLHDPPSKALDIATHGDRSDAAFRQAGFTDAEVGDYFAHADHTGAAADRLPFPWWRSSELKCRFDGILNPNLHPLGGPAGQTLKLPFHAGFKSPEQGIEAEGAVQPRLTDDSLAKLPSGDEQWRARFFAHWRLWAKQATEKDHRLALLPADTRIPDHSIWTHMQVTSALAGCVEDEADATRMQPAFLKFQLGPVQDFIAAARSIRDLWSGSFLLSWLMAAGMKALSAKVGPDAVIFPNLLGQPLFDLHWRKELWGQVHIGSQSVWDSLAHDEAALLTPNLPNVFLAVVPACRAAELGRLVEDAIRTEWRTIVDTVWQYCDERVLPGPERGNLTADEGALTRQLRQQRFDAQVKRFLSISWQATRWPDTVEEALKLADGFDPEMPIMKARDRVQAVVDMAEKQMPKAHRDVRYFQCECFPEGHPKTGWKDASKLKNDARLDNVGLGWAVILAFNGWQLDAVRQTRDFAAWAAGGWNAGTANNKDALNGRDEAVAGGQEWAKRCASDETLKTRFKKDDWIGAITLVKRLWDLTYLKKPDWNFSVQKMPNTRGIAAHDPFANDDKFNDDDQAQDVENLPASEKYFAVLALDGDEIGKWVSGEKTPPFASQLADYLDPETGVRHGALEYFQRESAPDGTGTFKERFADFLKNQRPLSPSYHLQFSQALTNFALLCARPIVEAFDGRLIYAGGDDVVALLPADTALECARALRMAFTGSPGLKETLRRSAEVLRQRHELEQETARRENRQAAPTPYCQERAAEGRLLAVAETTQDAKTISHPGFLARLDDCDQPPDKRRFADGAGRPIPFLVPGPAADCSVGIAIAHFKSPLQDVVRAAQAAEKRAKKQLGRSAVAVTLFKRSGETIEWGTQWGSSGLEIYRRMADSLEQGEVSSRFPYRIIALLEGYLTETTALSAKCLERVPDFDVASVMERELSHVIDRQGASQAAKAALRQEWLAPLGGPGQPSQLRRFLRWTTEQEARAAARKLAEKLTALADGKPDSPELQKLRDLADAPIGDDSTHLQTFRAIVQQLTGAGGASAPVQEAAARAVMSIENRLPETQLQSLIGLCQTVAFAHRTRSGATSES
jgi:CRISPR-associated protein Cas10/Cmr2 subtype III-B